MATITDTVVLSDYPQKNGFRYVKYQYTLLDNTSGTHIHKVSKLIAPDIQALADAVAGEANVLQTMADDEQELLRQESADGQIVLHIDAGGYYVHSVPLWATWEEQSTQWLKFWLSNEDQLLLVNMKLDLDQITNTELKDLLGIDQGNTSDIRAAVQVAVDTKAALNIYQPFYNNGIWV